METIIVSVLAILVIGLFLGLLIGYVANAFAVEVDPRIEEVAALLPGANCGGCGFAGCGDLAKAIVAGTASPDKCPVCPAASIALIAEKMGISASAKDPMIAVVLCGGDKDKTLWMPYNGIADCKSALLVAGGAKGCSYGCLGYGSCAHACPFGAIEIRDTLAVVHPELCTGCGKCVNTCPRKLIKLVPASAKVHVYCSSKAKGPAKKKVCDVPCIACRKCVKAAGEGQMIAEGFLVQVNYTNAPGEEIVAKAGCPTNCLRTAEAHVAIAAPSKKKSEEKVA